MTRHLKKLGLPCHVELNPGIVKDTRQELDFSMILAEQITTISKLQLRNYVGRVDDTELLSAIEQAICEQFSLAGPGYSNAKYIHNEMN